MLSIQSASALFLQTPTASAGSTFSNYPITSTYKKPGTMTVAGGDLWYLESSTASGPIDSIGRMTTSGTTTDYTIGYPGTLTSLTVSNLITGPDGNVWFNGENFGSVYIGKLDIATGAVTFYGAAAAYSAGSLAAGSDGKIYYTYKYSGGPANSYLKSLDPTTGTIATVRTYDVYSVLGTMTSGSDGRLYVGDGYYDRVYAISLVGGTSSTFSFSTDVSGLASGPDGNIWFSSGTKVMKMTTGGSTTEFNLPAGVRAIQLSAGPDGVMWFVDDTPSSPKIGRITTAGKVTTSTIPGTSVHYEVGGPVVGSDGAIWFNYRNNAGNYVGRLTTTLSLSSHPITSTYKNPGTMTVAGGDLWYLESSSATGPINSIGRMTTSGTTTDYTIGYPGSLTSLTVSNLITGPDGNVWFNGANMGSVYIGKLDIVTGAVTFYGAAAAYSAGSLAAGSDGKIYYTYKYSGGPANSYLRSLDPATGTTAAVHSYDTYSSLGGMITGSDGRLYIVDGYYKRIYARSLTGGTNNTYSFSTYIGKLSSGVDGNIWFSLNGTTVVKMTPGGVRTEFTLPTGVRATQLSGGTDSAMWFVDDTPSSPKIGRIDLTGNVTMYTIPGSSVHYEVGGPVLGSDEAIWFSYRNSAGHYLGKIAY